MTGITRPIRIVLGITGMILVACVAFGAGCLMERSSTPTATSTPQANTSTAGLGSAAPTPQKTNKQKPDPKPTPTRTSGQGQKPDSKSSPRPKPTTAKPQPAPEPKPEPVVRHYDQGTLTAACRKVQNDDSLTVELLDDGNPPATWWKCFLTGTDGTKYLVMSGFDVMTADCSTDSDHVAKLTNAGSDPDHGHPGQEYLDWYCTIEVN